MCMQGETETVVRTRKIEVIVRDIYREGAFTTVRDTTLHYRIAYCEGITCYTQHELLVKAPVPRGVHYVTFPSFYVSPGGWKSFSIYVSETTRGWTTKSSKNGLLGSDQCFATAGTTCLKRGQASLDCFAPTAVPDSEEGLGPYFRQILSSGQDSSAPYKRTS